MTHKLGICLCSLLSQLLLYKHVNALMISSSKIEIGLLFTHKKSHYVSLY